jgi:hypothetical protein
MCTKSACKVTLHRKTKVSVKEFGGRGTVVFIQVPPSGGRTDSSSVFLTPRVSTDVFDARLEVYLLEERTVDHWTSFFASLEATPNPMDKEKEGIADRFEQPPPISA